MSLQADQSFAGDVTAETLQGRSRVSVGNTPLVTGVGVPAFDAAQGALYLRTDVAELYQNTDGAGTWALVGGGGGSYPDITDTPGVRVDIGVLTRIVGQTFYNPLGLDVGVPTAAAGGLIAAIGDTTTNGNPVRVIAGAAAGGGNYLQALDADVVAPQQLTCRTTDGSGFATTGTLNDVAISSFSVATAPIAPGLTITGFAPDLSWQQFTNFPSLTIAPVFVANMGSANLTLAHQNAGSLAQNRFFIPGGNLVIPPGGGAIIRYGRCDAATGGTAWSVLAKGI